MEKGGASNRGVATVQRRSKRVRWMDPWLMMFLHAPHSPALPTPEPGAHSTKPGPQPVEATAVSLDVLAELVEPGTQPPALKIPKVYLDKKRRHVTGKVVATDLPQAHRMVRRLKFARQMDSHTANSQGHAAVPMQARTGIPVASGSTVGPRPIGLTGKGVVLGIIDNGCAFLHPSFRSSAGTRVEALWDQGGTPTATSRLRGLGFEYGREITRAEIDSVVRSRSASSGRLDMDGAYSDLAYLDRTTPATTHGMEVMDIAAGAEREDPLATESPIVFVQLPPIEGRPGFVNASANYALDALMYIDHVAGDRPAVICLCYSADTGPHDGSSILERAFDEFLENSPGRSIILSAGNNYLRRNHAVVTVADTQAALEWNVVPGDATWNFMNLWYPRSADLSVDIVSPDGQSISIHLNQSKDLVFNGSTMGWAAHRRGSKRKSNDSEILVALHPAFRPTGAGIGPGFPGDLALPGIWKIKLSNKSTGSVDVHAWIERDDASPTRTREQSHFAIHLPLPGTPPDQHRRCTLAGAVTGELPIVVGAYNSATATVCGFSSMGPRRDGRSGKPDICAPGASDPLETGLMVNETHSTNRYRVAGTSMAAAYTAGVIAQLYEGAARSTLTARQIRDAVIKTAAPIAQPNGVPSSDHIDRTGAGMLDPGAALAHLQALIKAPLPAGSSKAARKSRSAPGSKRRR